MDKLSDHIDLPIQKCVVGLALLGFKPIFSCCGFDYKDEKVKKDHLLGKPYIYLDANLSTNESKLLIDLARGANWIISFVPGGRFIDFYGNTRNDSFGWDKKGSPHRYEISVLSINGLEKLLEQVLAANSEKIKESVIITDGNKRYREELAIKHWQYEPAEDWIVTPETFRNL